MDYQQALLELRHTRTGKDLLRKKLCNKTYLRREAPEKHGFGPVVVLSLFEKDILYWYSNGSIKLDSCNFKTTTTKDRYKRYLPAGFAVWQSRPYWYVDTPSGVRPFYDKMRLSHDGQDTDLRPQVLNTMNAHEVHTKTHEYAKLFVQRLARGEIAEEKDCGTCIQQYKQAPMISAEHALEHVLQGATTARVLCEAFVESSALNPHMRDAVRASWTTAQKTWRRPRTNTQLIEQTELKMTLEQLPFYRPLRPYARELREKFAEFLLEQQFSFERMNS